MQSYGSKELDASMLQVPLVGFLPQDDPRVRGTVAAVEKHLLREGFVDRYQTRSGVDGLPPGEGAFLPCSFWLADNYVLQGRREEARALFEEGNYAGARAEAKRVLKSKDVSAAAKPAACAAAAPAVQPSRAHIERLCNPRQPPAEDSPGP